VKPAVVDVSITIASEVLEVGIDHQADQLLELHFRFPVRRMRRAFDMSPRQLIDPRRAENSAVDLDVSLQSMPR